MTGSRDSKPQCVHLGRVVQSFPRGDYADVRVCRGGFRYCTIQQSTLITSDGPLAACDTCDRFDDDNDHATDPLSCSHRSVEPIDRRSADLCGRRHETYQVYQCTIHGECALGRFCKKQREKSCVNCDERSAITQSERNL